MKPRPDAMDPYEILVYEHWDSLVHVFRQFEDKSPMLLFDIQEQRIYAYPYQDFVAGLAAKDQAPLAKRYKKVVDGQSIIVFVRDNDQRKLVSFTVDREA